MPTQHLHSLAHIGSLAEVPVDRVRKILAAIGARPAMVFNLTPFYDAEVCGVVIARAKGWSDQPAYHKTFHTADIRTEG